MTRLLTATLAAALVTVALASAAPRFTSSWRSPDAGSVTFAGQKIAALVISQDDSLRVAGEEGLVRELTARGWNRLRPIASRRRKSCSTLWGYYGYGWGSVYVPGSVDRDTIVVVETTIYSVPRNQLLWAAVSETSNPKDLQSFVEDLVKESVKELHEQGLARSIRK